MAKVLIACKLPNGLVLKHPTKPNETVTLRGLNSAPAGHNGALMAVPYMTTEVDADFWEQWYALHNHPTKPFGPLKSGAIYLAKNEEAAAKIAKEESGRRTGLEGMQPSDPRLGADGKKLQAAN